MAYFFNICILGVSIPTFVYGYVISNDALGYFGKCCVSGAYECPRDKV